MKLLSALVSLALAGTAAAQLDGLLPKCAQECATKFLQGGIGNCGRDPKCICSDQSFLGEIACCLVGVCNQADQSSAVAAAATLCSAFQVTNLPTAVSCSTGNGAPTTTAGAATTPSASSTNAAATGATTGSTPSASSPTTSTTTPVGAATNPPSTTTTRANVGPRPTAAAAGLGAIGGIIAAVAFL